MQLTDTHCHIHEAGPIKGDDPTRALWRKLESPDPDDIIQRAVQQHVTRLICVGTTVADSRLAVDFAARRSNCWASIGLHPHEAKEGESALQALADLLETTPRASSLRFPSPQVLAGVPAPRQRGTPPSGPLAASQVPESGDLQAESVVQSNKIIAIGECGLDYFYSHSPKEAQIKALRFQIELALQHNLPLIFHIREAFDDFWPVFDSYQNIRGVLHSFTDSRENLDKALARDLYIGMNGIITFTKYDWQLQNAKAIPLQKLLLETDAPFLTPVPFRGTVNEPAHLMLVARFLAELRGESVKDLAARTTANAQTLFKL